MIVLASLSTEQAMAIADKLTAVARGNLSYHEEIGDIKIVVRTHLPRLIDYVDVEYAIEDVLNDRD